MDQTTTAPAEATPAVATEATPAAPATEAKTETKAERMTSAVAELKKAIAAKRAPAETPSSEPAPATAPAAEKTVAKIEAAGGRAPEQKSGESDAQYELRLAKQFRELRQEKEGRAKAEKSVGEVSKRLAEIEKREEAEKKNPLLAMERLGWDLGRMIKEINEDKLSAPEKLSPEMAAIRDRLEALDRAEKERESQRLESERAGLRTQHEAQVAKFVTDNAEDFPLASVLPGTAQALVAEAYEKGEMDIIPLLKGFEASLQREMLPLMGSEAAIRALVKEKPELKAVFVKALGLEGAATTAPALTASLDSIPTEPGTPSGQKTRDQIRAEAVAGLKQARAQGRI